MAGIRSTIPASNSCFGHNVGLSSPDSTVQQKSTASSPSVQDDVRAASLSQGRGTRGAPGADRLSRGRMMLFGISLILVALNLRTLFPSFAVLLPEIARDLELSASGASYLTTLPVLCMGVFAPLAAQWSQRIGPDRTLLGAILVLSAAIALRGAGLPGLYIGTLLGGAGIALGNVLLPVIIKRDFARHTGIMTGFYTMAICAGAAIAAAATLPLSASLSGSWTAGLVFWSLPAGAAALAWMLQAKHFAPVGPVRLRKGGTGIWRQPLAWYVTGFMGLQSSLAFSVLGWLAPILRERGMEGVDAGLVVSILILAQIAGCLVVPIIAMRCRSQRALATTLSAMAVAGILAMVFAPLSAVWPWALVQGVGQGGLLACALTIVVLRSPDVRVAAQLSAMSQSVGYAIAALAPWTIGALRDWTGGFTSTGPLFIVIGVGLFLTGWGAGRHAVLPTSA